MNYTFDFMSVFANWDRLLMGAWLTIQLSALSIALGFVVGTLCAIAGKSRLALVRGLIRAYVEIIRNTPLLVQVFLVFFGLASIGWKLSAETAAVIALTVNVGAYTTEIMRAGINSIHPGQIEAAECLGMSRLHVYWHVVLLPAVERVYPSLTSQFILLMLASSITSQISAEELTATANLVQSETFRSFEVYAVIAVAYLALSFLFRGAFWLISQLAFVRKRKLGTNL
ncbi:MULTISPECIES: amino acid ABC transporter permease [Herbaspirillum]|uniref:Amino acid ABC transporter permease n=1 Tax=Herbaspirillum frisingense GSF30 TaxID=864073 RepID=A0AAI9N4Z2_9BURK|nr:MULTISPECIES: amino acid ABC transporter permease [Herbaspirillum]EOA05960.1 amino acid ABC transporter permease [Herbaspirillum frisingense GSF30]MCI1016316.1 amino acid ABC transporter permease [Herbaspirillum sp. C7C2]UIN20656.1 amino acid ABC transporter permease [Herbaspirillum frisingense]